MCVHMRALPCVCVQAAIRVKKKCPGIYSAIQTALTDLLSQRGIRHFGVIRQAAILCPSLNRTQTSWLILINFVIFPRPLNVITPFCISVSFVSCKGSLLTKSYKVYKLTATSYPYPCLRQPTLPLSMRINTGSLYRNVSILNYKRDKDNVS